MKLHLSGTVAIATDDSTTGINDLFSNELATDDKHSVLVCIVMNEQLLIVLLKNNN